MTDGSQQFAENGSPARVAATDENVRSVDNTPSIRWTIETAKRRKPRAIV
jgi:hypothetical protein